MGDCMNKQELFDAMKGRISKTSIKEYSGEFVIMGKYGMVSWMGDYWDVWLTGAHHGKELGTQLVTYRARALEPLVKSIDTAFNNEATAIVEDNEGAFLCALLLGARRKRKDSPKSLAALRIENLKKANLARLSK